MIPWTSPPGSSVHGILQERILEWVVNPFSRASSWPRDRTCISDILSLKKRKRSLGTMCMCMLVAQLYRTFCDPMDCSPPCSSVHGILQARILKCGAIPFYRGSSGPRDRTHISCIVGRYFIIWATGEAQINKYFFKNQKKTPLTNMRIVRIYVF